MHTKYSPKARYIGYEQQKESNQYFKHIFLQPEAIFRGKNIFNKVNTTQLS